MKKLRPQMDHDRPRSAASVCSPRTAIMYSNPLTAASSDERQHTELAGATAKRPAAPLVRTKRQPIHATAQRNYPAHVQAGLRSSALAAEHCLYSAIVQAAKPTRPSRMTIRRASGLRSRILASRCGIAHRRALEAGQLSRHHSRTRYQEVVAHAGRRQRTLTEETAGRVSVNGSTPLSLYTAGAPRCTAWHWRAAFQPGR